MKMKFDLFGCAWRVDYFGMVSETGFIIHSGLMLNKIMTWIFEIQRITN